MFIIVFGNFSLVASLGLPYAVDHERSTANNIAGLFVRLMAKNLKCRLGRPRKTCLSCLELDIESANILCSIVALIIQLH